MHAVAGRCEVYMDGGVRTGTDVLKALALGARAVFIGRPAIYALAYNVCIQSCLIIEVYKKIRVFQLITAIIQQLLELSFSRVWLSKCNCQNVKCNLNCQNAKLALSQCMLNKKQDFFQ